MSEDMTRFTLPLPHSLAARLRREAEARTRTRNKQAEVLLDAALNLNIERLPVPLKDESATTYRARLQRIADGGS